uniref:Integrase zinc-binding domain-containing protein n=1 Tax=Romanomermis culicivorax TaxID=13658 RepID=A0A915LAM3_ROMCU
MTTKLIVVKVICVGSKEMYSTILAAADKILDGRTLREVENTNKQKIVTKLLCTYCYCPKHEAYSKSVQTRNEKSSGKLSRESDQQTKIDEQPENILSLNQIAVYNLTIMLNSMEMDIESIQDKSVKDALEKHATNVKQQHEGLWTTNNTLHDKILCKQRDGGQNKVIVAEVLKKLIIESYHNDLLAGHFGTKKTIQSIKIHYYLKSLPKDVQQHCGSCKTCQKNKPLLKKIKASLKPIPVSGAFVCIGDDCFSP